MSKMYVLFIRKTINTIDVEEYFNGDHYVTIKYTWQVSTIFPMHVNQ